MMELFDMGKYDFYVWSSITVFILALGIDFITARNQHKKIKKLIKARARRNRS